MLRMPGEAYFPVFPSFLLLSYPSFSLFFIFFLFFKSSFIIKIFTCFLFLWLNFFTDTCFLWSYIFNQGTMPQCAHWASSCLAAWILTAFSLKGLYVLSITIHPWHIVVLVQAYHCGIMLPLALLALDLSYVTVNINWFYIHCLIQKLYFPWRF